jgi:hypothetical protein
MDKWVTRIFLGVVGFVAVMTVSLQLSWESDRFLPGTQVLGVDVSRQTREDVREEVMAALAGEIVVRGTGGVEIVRIAVDESQVDWDEVLARAGSYGLVERLIPGSILFAGALSSMGEVRVPVDAEGILAGVPREAIEGAVSVGSEVVVRPAEVGYVIDEAEWRTKLGEVKVGAKDAVIEVKAEVAQPRVDAETLGEWGQSLRVAREGVAGAFKGQIYGFAAVGMDGYWSVGDDENQVFTSASTYKLYIAYTMITEVEAGRWNWSSRLNGQTLEACLTTMIVDSDNDCPEAWLVKQGFNWTNARVQEIGGLTGTQIANGRMLTTPHDLAVYLGRLYRGELLSAENTEKLLGLMKRQTHREGIPAGVASSVVADKPGWLTGLVNDAAIVFDPSGDYVLVIMTEGATWETVAKMAGVIDGAVRGL